jgi:hypothetical protein
LSKVDLVPTVSSEHVEQPRLTPASWQRVNDDVRSSSGDSSSLKIFERVHS